MPKPIDVTRLLYNIDHMAAGDHDVFELTQPLTGDEKLLLRQRPVIAESIGDGRRVDVYVPVDLNSLEAGSVTVMRPGDVKTFFLTQPLNGDRLDFLANRVEFLAGGHPGSKRIVVRKK